MSPEPSKSKEAEMSVLGSVFCDNECLKKITGILDGLDFYYESHRKIFHAFLSLRTQNEPIDIVTVTNALQSNGHLEEAGGGSYLANLIEHVPTSANVGYYCKIVKNKATSRRIMELGQNMMFMAAEETNDTAEIIKKISEDIKSISGSMDGLSGISQKDILDIDQRSKVYAEHIRTIDRARFKTHFKDLDGLIRGVAPGEVMTITAYAGTFKTSFLQNILLRNAKKTGRFHLFFSLEMPAAKLYERECQYAYEANGFNIEDLHRRNVAEGINLALCDSGSVYLLVCDKPRLSLDKISRYVDIARQKYGEIGAIGIDYVGLMDAPGKTLFEKTQFISAETKNLAKEANIPIVNLCQINRDSAKNVKGIETYSAKGGGDIEAGCDFMLGFYLNGENLMCKLLKNRNGPAGMLFDVEIDKPSLKFRDITFSHYTGALKQEAFE